jgi:hypothetical protein
VIYSESDNSSGDFFRVGFPSKDTENILCGIRFNICQIVYLLSQKRYSSKPELNKNWTKVLYKRCRPAQDETEREAKHAKESEHRLNQTSTSNQYTALLEEENED